MTSAYGSFKNTLEWNQRQKVLDALVPIRDLYLKDKTRVCIVQLRKEHTGLCEQAQTLLNLEIKAGSYPQDRVLDMEGFHDYYLSYFAFACIEDGQGSMDDVHLIGCFYIKPNFPGRSSHICNTGFLVQPEWRGKGVGSLMEKAFTWLASQLSFGAAFFNLVYADNEASVAFWKKHGYQIVGTIPGAKKVVREEDGTIDYVDAWNMWKSWS
jgi:GNAT superfamily N-acetyltransferase